VEDLPDICIARKWLGPAFEAAASIASEGGIDAVLISMSPFDLSFVGTRIQAELGLPVILDLRDPWALDGWRVRRGRRAWREDDRVMSEALASAAGVVANTPAAREALLSRVCGLDPRRVEVVTNGYDEADFPALPPAPRDRGRFRLVHSGSMHSSQIRLNRGLAGWLRRRLHYRPEPIDPTGRTPHYLFRALETLRRSGHPLPDTIEIVAIGQPDPYTLEDAASFGLEDRIRNLGYVDHLESIRWLQRADALFLPLHDLPPGRRSLIVPGKTYEYLAAGRPILACVPAGDARDLVERTGRGYLAAPCDPASIASALGDLHRDWTAGRLDESPRPDWICEYDRRALTSRLAAFLDRTTAAPGGSRT
jgi:glycosyltransferase involved in cell wall biosynthesis